MSAVDQSAQTLTKKDFVSDQEVRWCPGCGDYAILAAMQKTLPKLGIAKEKVVFISGIGCSSRFPYYMNTYGFHTIHGRALPIATGLASTRPDLTIFVITGDGDAFSIGGNHFIHALRRNVNLNVLCFNNKIYGLTKGQYSPTSESGKNTKSTPFGSLEEPLKPLNLALAAQGSFIARSVDIFAQHLSQTIEQSVAHKGLSFVEIYQNCNIFNDGAHADIINKDKREDNLLYLEHGQAMRFGKDLSQALFLNKDGQVYKDTVNADNEHLCLKHNSNMTHDGIHAQLCQMEFPDFPVPLGIIKQSNKACYDDMIQEQWKQVRKSRGHGNLQSLLNGKQTWTV